MLFWRSRKFYKECTNKLMVILKSLEEIKYIRKSCKLAASALKKILENIKEGITTLELE